MLYFIAVSSAMQNFIYDTWLLIPLLARVVVICIHDTGWIYKLILAICLCQILQVFIVIVRNRTSTLTQRTTQDAMCQWISIGLCLITREKECMLCLCSHTGIEHNRDISACRILHTNRDINTTRCQTVCLILHTSCSNCHIRKNVLQIWPVIGIEHLICCSKSCLADCLDVHLPDCFYTFDEIRLIFRVWLMQHTLIPGTVRTRLVCIDSWDHQNLILDLLCNRC